MTDGAHIAAISGTSAGIGQATPQAFARAGYRVALIVRSQRGLMDTQTELQAPGARTLAIAADVGDSEAVERAAARIETELSAIDVWVNSAMVTVNHPVSQLTAEEFRYHRPGRLGIVLPGDPITVGLLRREIRHPQLHRRVANSSMSTATCA